MRVQCRLREIRGHRTLREISDASKVSQPDLSRIERGQQLPSDESLTALEAAYGESIVEWYPPMVLLALSQDDDA